MSVGERGEHIAVPPDRKGAAIAVLDKGCGPQPEVVPRVEPAHITIARAALEAK
jgi:hypothetical protein